MVHRTRMVEVVSADAYDQATGGAQHGGQVIGEDGLAGTVDTVDPHSHSIRGSGTRAATPSSTARRVGDVAGTCTTASSQVAGRAPSSQDRYDGGPTNT